jgi:hypothetical protein
MTMHRSKYRARTYPESQKTGDVTGGTGRDRGGEPLVAHQVPVPAQHNVFTNAISPGV